MKKATDLGMNRTGLSTAPKLAREMMKGRDAFVTDGAAVDAGEDARRTYLEEAQPLGSVPPPLTGKGMAKSAGKMLKGEKATVLVDKMAERLAFERTGVRLYDAFLLKLQAHGTQPGAPSIDEVRRIREDEHAHFELVREAIEKTGADPTVQTPSADLEGVASHGLLQAMSDPRTGVREGLQVLLHAERADQDGWDLLVDLCEGLDEEDLAAGFRSAQESEVRHGARVRQWLRDMTLREAGGSAASVDSADEPV